MESSDILKELWKYRNFFQKKLAHYKIYGDDFDEIFSRLLIDCVERAKGYDPARGKLITYLFGKGFAQLYHIVEKFKSEVGCFSFDTGDNLSCEDKDVLRIWNQSISDQRESDKIVRALVALYTMPTPGQDGNWKKKAIRLLYKGKTVEQVAKRLKKSRQAVYDELKRAKNHIQKTMETKDLDGMSEFSIEKIYRGPKLKRKRRKGVKYEKRKG